MARRRSLNRRRSRRSLNTSGILNDDTNVFEDDDDLWFERIPDESNISMYKGSRSYSRYLQSFLDPDSDVIERLDDDEPYWERLNETNPDLLPQRRAGPSPNKSARKSNTINETLSSESSTIPPVKKRKLLSSKNRKSTGDVFSQALEDSEPAIESEPVPVINRSVQDHRKVLSQSYVVDQTHRSGFQSSESASDTDQRTKRTIFKKPRRTSTSGSRASLYDKVLNESDASVVGPSQPSEDRRTFVKPRTTFSNSPRYNSQSKSNMSQQSLNKDLESDSDFELASQQRPLFRHHVKQVGDPFASIISDSGSERDVGQSQSQRSLEQSRRSIQSESRREEKLRSEILRVEETKENEDEKSLTSVGSKTSNSRRSNNFELRVSAGEHSDRLSRDKNSMPTRALSVHSDISENKSSTTSISETFKSIENLPSDYENFNSQDFETIGEVENGVEPMEADDQVLGQSQSQETRESTLREAAGMEVYDFEEDEEMVNKENRESLNNLEEDINVSQTRKSPKKSVSLMKSGKKIRITSDVIIASQQVKDISSGELTEKRRTRQSEGDSIRKSSHTEVELKKRSVGRKTRSRRISEVDKLASEIETEKSLNVSVKITRSGRIFEDLETGRPENKSPGKAKRSRSKTNEKVEGEVSLEKSLSNSQRKTRSGRLLKELEGDSEEDAERSRRMFEERKKITKKIFNDDSESENDPGSPEKVSERQSKSLRVSEPKYSSTQFSEAKKSLGRKDKSEESQETVGTQEDPEISQIVDSQEDEEFSEEIGNQADEEETSQEVENPAGEEEKSQEIENQEDGEGISPNLENEGEISPAVENQEEDEEESEEDEGENEEERNKKTAENQEKEISRIESLEQGENELISGRKSKLGSPKHSSTRYLNRTSKSFDESDSEEIDEELDKYVRNTSKLAGLQNKTKQPEINPSPNDLPFRESDSEKEENLEVVKKAIEVLRPSEARPSTSGIKKVKNNVESNKSRGSKPSSSNQRSILSFFENATARPSLHISTKPLASSDSLKEVNAKMQEMKKHRDEWFAKQMEEEMNAKAKPVKLVPVKKKKVGTNLLKKNVKPKEVNKAYIVDGRVYKKPRLPRPKHWATDRLYKFLWKKMEPKFDLQTRIKSEKFVTELAEVVEIVKKKKEYKDYKFILEELLKKMARLGIIVTRKDFYDFCYEFLPYEFREKVTPMLLPGAVHLVPFEPEKLNKPILEG